MITILEGPDCGGKTTLAHGGFQSAKYLHFGPPAHGNTAWLEYTQELRNLEIGLYTADEEIRTYKPVDVVLDRFIYGERVYGPIMRDDVSFSRAHQRMLERVLLSLEAVLIGCMPPFEVVRDAWQERLDDEYVQKEQQLEQIYLKFQEIFLGVSLPYIHYDYTLESAAGMASKAKANKPPKNEGPGYGMFRPGVVLMVGEQINTNAVETPWPFVDDGGSSLWLADQLDMLGIPESSFYWINALDRAGTETPANFIYKLRPRLVVAMGTAAKVWVQRNKGHLSKAERVDVPHPQYWKRFKSKQEYPLLQLLKQVGQ